MRLFDLDRLSGALSRVCLWASGLALVTVLAIGAADTIGTQLFGRAVPSAIELMEAFEVVLIFGALPWVARTRAHIAMDVLTLRFGPRGQRLAALLAAGAGAVLFGLMAHAGWALFQRSFAADELSHGFVAFPLWPFKFVLLLTCVAAALEFVLIFAATLRGRTLDGRADAAAPPGLPGEAF